MKKTNYDLTIINKLYNDKAKAEFHQPRGNNKLGTINAWNLAPVITCSGEACKTCAVDGCYAVKNMFAHGYNYDTNNVLKAWLDNTKLAKTDLETLEKRLDAYLSIIELSISSCKFFRIHSSGDFFSVEYAKMWARLAMKHTGINFLAFTKCWDIVREHDNTSTPFYEIDNFSLVLSGWTGIEIPEDLKEHYYCAYCVEKGGEIPEDAMECPGHCDTCGMCWNLKKIKKNTYFNKH